MKALVDLIARGGPVMFAIIALSIVLYSRCVHLLCILWFSPAEAGKKAAQTSFQRALQRDHAKELRETFRQQRLAVGAMIAAAPLLGLLGTVSGMVQTFESLSSQMGQKSMGGLAGGISQVLVATESGLTVAIPALLLLALAHRQMHRRIQKINIDDLHRLSQ